ncbi:TetR/AcrR family transcriptional regulator [Clostridium sediminicola]|uniref:TetR/AcrR family transcriptional regulator n=1 Tax=Clostridium sediminicola TaxID=3114879 RepID=UPI0031F22F86
MVKKGRKVSENKKNKRDNLFKAADQLFSTKGINDTVIDDIVKKAGVAKGTFYLYFKNKYDIIERLMVRKSMKILKNSMEKLEEYLEKNTVEYSEQILVYTDFIIEDLKKDKKTLKLIYKNLSWGFFKKVISEGDSEHSEEVKNILSTFIDYLASYGIEEKEAMITLFMIIELTGSICYSSIILNEPYSMDEMKPYLFKCINKMVKCGG